MSDYTPDFHEVQAAYTDWIPEMFMEKRIAEFDRFISRVKADALREAAEDMDNTDDPDAIHIANGDADLWLKARAERIESGDRQ